MEREADNIPLLEKSPRFGKALAIFLAAVVVVFVIAVAVANPDSVNFFSKRHHGNNKPEHRHCDKHVSKKVRIAEQQFEMHVEAQEVAGLVEFTADDGAFVGGSTNIVPHVKEAIGAIVQGFFDAGYTHVETDTLCTLSENGYQHELGVAHFEGKEPFTYFNTWVEDHKGLKNYLNVPFLTITAPENAEPAVATNSASRAVLRQLDSFVDAFNEGKITKIKNMIAEDAIVVYDGATEINRRYNFLEDVEEFHANGLQLTSTVYHLAGGDDDQRVFASVLYKWEGGEASLLWQWELDESDEEWRATFIITPAEKPVQEVVEQ